MSTAPTPESSSSANSKPDFTQVAEAPPASPKDEALAALERELDDEKDARVEERFLWIIVVVILVDVIWFNNSPNPALPIIVLILQVIGLFILARRMGVEEAVGLLERVLAGLGERGKGG